MLASWKQSMLHLSQRESFDLTCFFQKPVWRWTLYGSRHNLDGRINANHVLRIQYLDEMIKLYLALPRDE